MFTNIGIVTTPCKVFLDLGQKTSSPEILRRLTERVRETTIKHGLQLDYMKEALMKEIHQTLKQLKKEFPMIYKAHEALGKEIHEKGGPLPEKTRWLMKIAISGASGHRIALETHILKAREAGATDAEIMHTLLLIIQTTGFPAFMEAYSVYKHTR